MRFNLVVFSLVLIPSVLAQNPTVSSGLIRTGAVGAAQSLTASASRSAFVASRSRALAGQVAPSNTLYFAVGQYQFNQRSSPEEIAKALSPAPILASQRVRNVEIDVNVRRLTPVRSSELRIGATTLLIDRHTPVNLNSRATIDVPGLTVIR